MDVSIEEDESTLIAWIKDTGFGIPEEDLPQLFERFLPGQQGSLPFHRRQRSRARNCQRDSRDARGAKSPSKVRSESALLSKYSSLKSPSRALRTMRFRRQPCGRTALAAVLLTTVLLATVLLAGCFHREESAIPPEREPQGRSEIGLGPGIRPLSAGLGEKGSPSWNPSGDRIAFTMDDYVVEKAPAAQDFERKTTKDFKARTVSWTPSGDGLAILGADAQSGSAEPQFSGRLGLYKTTQGESSLEISKVATGVQDDGLRSARAHGGYSWRWKIATPEAGSLS